MNFLVGGWIASFKKVFLLKKNTDSLCLKSGWGGCDKRVVAFHEHVVHATEKRTRGCTDAKTECLVTRMH